MKQDLVCGYHAVVSCLSNHPKSIQLIMLDTNRKDKRIDQIQDLARQFEIKIQRVDKARLDEASGEDLRHQGVIARVAVSPVYSEKNLKVFLTNLSDTPLLLVLDGVQDPHNFGACLRSAAAAGVQGVIIKNNNAVAITPVVRRVACGGAEIMPVFRVSNLSRSLKLLKEHGVWLIGASGEADTEVFDTDLTTPLAIVLGAEGKGLKRLTREHCDLFVNIPMLNSIGSLNVSVAAGICLFEVVRQRTRK